MKTYGNMYFGPNKNIIEKRNFNAVKEKGGWFGLTHKSLDKHYHMFKKNLREKSPFLIVERDNSIIPKVREQKRIIGDNRIKIVRGDLFEALFGLYPKTGYNVIDGKPLYRVPLFLYGHLDFCCSACGLTDEMIEFNIRKLAKWWNLKNNFYLDITVAHRGDKNMMSATTLIEHFIPVSFMQLNWNVEFMEITDYKDSSLMRNAFFKFSRKNKRQNRNYYID